MRRSLTLLSVVAALGCLGAPAQAQFGRRAPTPAADPSQVDCAALARMPSAPMTQEACETMMANAGAMQAALNAPGGERPVDEAMSCEAIKAELSQQQNVGVSREHIAEGQAAAQDYMAREKRIRAEGAAVAAQQTATTVGAAALSVVPGVGNVAATAAAGANMASTQAFAAHANAELTPAKQRMFTATGASMGDVARSMQDNPRFARLARLAQEKNCH